MNINQKTKRKRKPNNNNNRKKKKIIKRRQTNTRNIKRKQKRFRKEDGILKSLENVGLTKYKQLRIQGMKRIYPKLFLDGNFLKIA